MIGAMKRPVAIVPAPRPQALPVPTPGAAAHVLAAAAEKMGCGVRCVLATVIERHGSAPGTPGQKLLLAEDGTCIGTVGGGAVEREVLESLVKMLEQDRSHEARGFKLGPELGMCCGGQLKVLFEPLEALVPCLIVGGGHVATAVAPMLAKIGYAVTVVDSRDRWGEEGRIPGIRTIVGDYDDLEVDVRGVFLVMTHDHALDQRAIEWALKKGFAYVGGVGSRAKAQRTRQRLAAKGFSEDDRARVRMPIGVDIGARLPHEIAVAIAAEMVAWRRRTS
jgi:xanthine dehydrogenase accessory factor